MGQVGGWALCFFTPLLASTDCTYLCHTLQNQLTGSIPTELGKINLTRAFDLQSNKLTSAVCTELGRLNLTSFSVRSNSLSSAIPTGECV